MTYTFTSSWGNDVILAPCLQALCREIAQRYPDAVNLGEIGDAAHAGEGYGSDHNPFITHNGKRYVRAIDIGGPRSIQTALFVFIQTRYEAHDSRVWPYGYVHMNNQITTWFGTGTHYDPGDVGHLHISVTQANGNHPSPSGWVSALDRTDGWGLIDTGDDMSATDVAAVNKHTDAVAQKLIGDADTPGATLERLGTVLHENTDGLAAHVTDLDARLTALSAQMARVVAKLGA